MRRKAVEAHTAAVRRAAVARRTEAAPVVVPNPAGCPEVQAAVLPNRVEHREDLAEDSGLGSRNRSLRVIE